MFSHYMICASLVLLAVPANAQPAGFARPMAGFVFSPVSRTVRPLFGAPGASYAGAAVLKDVDQAWIAPAGRWAYVSTAGRSLFMGGLAEEAPVESVPDGAIDAVDRVAWGPDASFAVLYSSSGGQLQRVRLAGGQAAVDDPLDLTPWGVPTTLAIDASGRRIAFGIAGAGVYLIDGAQPPALLTSMARPAVAAFSDSGRLFAVDADARRIVEFGPDLSPTDFAVVDNADDAAFDPVGLAVSGTGKYLMVADRGTQTVRVYETETRTLADTIGLDLAPTHMHRLSDGATFLLNRPRAGEWLLVLDATDKPRVYFVPGGEEAAQ
jgi:hypothetical protein